MRDLTSEHCVMLVEGVVATDAPKNTHACKPEGSLHYIRLTAVFTRMRGYADAALKIFVIARIDRAVIRGV